MGVTDRLRGAIISAAPMLVLGFTMFVVALNMRYVANDAVSVLDRASDSLVDDRSTRAMLTGCWSQLYSMRQHCCVAEDGWPSKRLIGIRQGFALSCVP